MFECLRVLFLPVIRKSFNLSMWRNYAMEELKYFFSYSRKDSEFVLQLAQKLRAAGANVWLDQLDIPAGQHWDRTIGEALKSCKGVIAVLSPESVASDNVMDEVSYALKEKKLVVPVLIRPCDIPYRLQRVQHIDFTANYDTGFAQLRRALSIEQPVQPLESAAPQEPVVEEPSLPKQSESIPDEQKPAKAGSKSQTAKVFATIGIAALIVIVSIGVFLIYRPKTYSLNVTAVNGVVTKSPDQANYNHGEAVTLEAVPNEAYSFRNWSGDLSGNTNPTTLTMDADKSVTASFALKAKAGDVVTNHIGMKLVYIHEGLFEMGSWDSAEQLAKDYKKYGAQKEQFADEFPRHKVRISKGFWMGQTEVTQGQYKSVMNAEPWSKLGCVQESANNPAVYVTWDSAVDFCRKLSILEGETYRLPTEAEWEYACRAGTITRFSFGNDANDLGEYAWFYDNAANVGQEYAHPVGEKKPNDWGLYDMHGNVCEWCSDFYGPDYYSNSPSVDPNGPPSGNARSLRGGALNHLEDNLRCSRRPHAEPGWCLFETGFRVVRSQ